jgi:hypothetical protein
MEMLDRIVSKPNDELDSADYDIIETVLFNVH